MLKIEKLPDELRDEGVIQEHFEKFGNVLSTEIIDDETAIVKYADLDDAANALKEGTQLGDNTLLIKMAEKESSVLQSVLEPSGTPEVEVMFSFYFLHSSVK